ncbi:T9SS type A sorting domain-containing protein [candidate division KSB1 bacterium]|nr:T9SS type A sorting domain-containing protein [candidate division KSB1 bacterium]
MSLFVFPNPSNSTITIRYVLKKSSVVRVELYSSHGRLVKRLLEDYKERGEYSVLLDGDTLASGLYVVRLCANDGTIYRRLLFLK